MRRQTRRRPASEPETANPSGSRPPDPSFATVTPANDHAADTTTITPITPTDPPDPDGVDHHGLAEPATKAPPGSRVRDSLLWLWFVITVASMAAAGTLWGQFGALLAAVVLTAGIILFAGYAIVPARALLVVFVVAVFAAAGILALRIQGQPVPAEPSTQAGRRLSADFVRSAPRQGAIWPGVILDREVIQDWELTGLTAPGSSMRGTWLEGARLAGADLRGADLWGAHLHGADLRAANLRGADLRYADLSVACLIGADLTGALLAKAQATDAAVAGATVDPQQTRQATWPPADRSTATGCP